VFLGNVIRNLARNLAQGLAGCDELLITPDALKRQRLVFRYSHIQDYRTPRGGPYAAWFLSSER